MGITFIPQPIPQMRVYLRELQPNAVTEHTALVKIGEELVAIMAG
jgi:hypothetical protein